MKMNKKIASVIIFLSLFCLVSFSSAQVTIPNPLGETNSFPALLEKIAIGVGTFISSLGTIMIIVAGILYLTSAGSPERINTAKKALIYAIVGIAIGISAYAIVAIIKGILTPPVA
jgi:hypothetical protein